MQKYSPWTEYHILNEKQEMVLYSCQVPPQSHTCPAPPWAAGALHDIYARKLHRYKAPLPRARAGVHVLCQTNSNILFHSGELLRSTLAFHLANERAKVPTSQELGPRFGYWLSVFCVPSSTMLLPTNNETHAMHPKELTQWGEVCCDEETISSCVPVWEPVSKIQVKTKDLDLE